jgi:exosortase B
MTVYSAKPERPPEAVSSPRPGAVRLSTLYLAAMAASFLVAYAPTYATLAKGAWQSDEAGHGPLIMLAAAWLAWQQRAKLKSAALRPAPVSGWMILFLSLALMAVTRSQDILMIEVATQIPVLLGCVLLIGGWRLARVFAFPLGFLVFAVPPPGWVMDAGTVPLKTWISDLVTNFLYALDYPIAQNGVVIMIGSYELMVKDACSGINSIFALSAIGFFYVHEFVRGHWVRGAILIASIVPITVLANVLRVLALVLGAYYLGADRIEGLFHDTMGISLFVFALVLFFALDGLLISAGYFLKKSLESFHGASALPKRAPTEPAA